MATQAQLLDAEAFNQLVLEEGLKTWEQSGYIYTGKRGKNGWELYRAYGPKWRMLYQSRRVATQANAAGGAVIIDIAVATGMTATLRSMNVVNSGNNTLNLRVLDEDNAKSMQMGNVGAAGANELNVPSIGSVATSSGNTHNTQEVVIGPGEKLCASQANAGAQNDTMTVSLVLLLPITATEADVTWSTARSTNPGNVTLAASTISAANTLQAVLLP